MIYMSDMLPFKAHIQNGTFKRSTLTKSSSAAKIRQRPASRANKTDSVTSRPQTSNARAQARDDYKAAANDYIRNWRKTSATRRVTSRSTSLTADAQPLPPSNITRPKTAQRTASSSSAGVRTRPKTGTRKGFDMKFS